MDGFEQCDLNGIGVKPIEQKLIKNKYGENILKNVYPKYKKITFSTYFDNFQSLIFDKQSIPKAQQPQSSDETKQKFVCMFFFFFRSVCVYKNKANTHTHTKQNKKQKHKK